MGSKTGPLWLTLVILGCLYGHLLALTCRKNSDCNPNDCCIEYLPFIKRCVDSGDDVGDRCGGQFYCDCKPGLICKEHPPSMWNFLKLGKGRCQSAKGDSRYSEHVEIVTLS